MIIYLRAVPYSPFSTIRGALFSGGESPSSTERVALTVILV
jgi:hypothetical protein